MKKTNKRTNKRTLSVLLVLYFNSMLYGVISYFSTKNMDIWSLTHYFILAFFYLSFAIDYEKNVIKRKSLSLLTIPLALVIMFSGYLISESRMPFFIILFALQGIAFVAINITLYVSKKQNTIKKQIKQEQELSLKNIDRKKLFLSKLFQSLTFFVIIGLIIVSSLACHANLSRITLRSTFFVLLFVCVILSFYKNYYFYNTSKKSFVVFSLIENIWFAFFSVIYYYLNAVVYYGKNEFFFYVYLIPVISLIPFFAMAKKIKQQYLLICSN